MKLTHNILKIDGMTCTGCERRIEKALSKLSGVIEVKANFTKSNIDIKYNPSEINITKISNTIESLDYVVKNIRDYNQNIKESTDKMSTNQLIGIGIIIFAVYIIIKNTIGFNFIPQINQNMGYGILFVVGLLTSLHCIAMCGGINLSQCVSYKTEGNSSKFLKFKPSLMYNMGRVISYTIIGGIVGTFGSVVSFSGYTKGIIAILSGAFMMIIGLNMLNIFPWLRKLNPKMPKIFANKIHKESKKGPFYVGLLNGLMPCGPLQAMQIYALGTGSFLAGATSMFLFSLGTVPLMFGFGAISSLLSRKFTHKMLKVSALLVMFLGIIMINRGLNLSGISFAATKAVSISSNIARIEGNVQVVNTTMQSGNYSPIIVQKGIPVKWTITATSEDLNGCNNPVTIPKYNIKKKLVPGDNLIDEFTPAQEGNITYTCWMGMISSTIKVVPDISKVSDKDIQQIQTSNNDYGISSAAPGCCAGINY